MSRLQTTITGVIRETSSTAGNPQFTVTTTNGSFKTAEDASVAYSIENSEYKGEVILTIDRGKIVGVSTLDGSITAGRQA